MAKDDEIVLDFSKFKKIFKKESEKEKVQQVEQRAEQVQQSDISPSDAQKVSEVQKDLEKKEDEAAIVDAEKKLLDKEIEKDEKIIQTVEKKSDDEEISFDFGKVKKMFKKDKAESSEEEVSFDLKAMGAFIKKHRVILLLLIPLILSISLRAIPAYLPITDNWAESTIQNQIRAQINAEVAAQYPNLPQANRDNLVSTRLEQFLSANEQNLEQQKKQLGEQFRSRLQKDGQTYLIAIDPYFWMRHAQNVLDHGHPGDELRDINTREPCEIRSRECVPWDNRMIAPVGRPAPYDMLHAYVIAHTHKTLSIFNPNQDIMASTFIVPIFLSALCVIPSFFIARKIGGNLAGFIAGSFVAIHPGFLTRTVGGFADTDPYNVLFPLFITWFFLLGFDFKGWKSWLFSGLAGLSVAFYSVTWGGWWYIFDFLIVGILGYFVIEALTHRDNLKHLKQKTMRHSGQVLIAFIISAMIFTSVVSNFSTFEHAVKGPFDFLTFKEVGVETIWPNVFTTVAEQNEASLDSVINQVGTGRVFLFLLAILGIALTLVNHKSIQRKDLYYFAISAIWIGIILGVRPQNLLLFICLIALPIAIRAIWAIYEKDKMIDFKLAIILVIWFCSTTFASTRGIRYILLLVPAASIGLGVAFSFIYRVVSKFLSKNLYIGEAISKSAVAIVLVLLLVNPYQAAAGTASNEIPSMNDAWYSALDKINQESDPNAIINSWWDFGHWFKAIGGRKVTFDGTSQGTPMAHWMGHALMTNNEDRSIGILRMLGCGSNNAFVELDKEVDDVAKSVEILHDIVILSKEGAREELLGHVSEDTTENVLELTHCEPPENYFVTSDDMIGKSGVWAHFGSWNFDRALAYNIVQREEYRDNQEKSVEFFSERFDLTEEEARSLYLEARAVRDSNEANSWIAPWPSYASAQQGCSPINITTWACPVRGQGGTANMIVDVVQRTANIQTPEGIRHPNSIVFPTPDGLEKTEYENDTIGFGMTMFPTGNSWSYIMSAVPLEGSMFTRLYFMDGHGLTKFKKFTEEQSVIGNRIVVWKVEWEGEEPNKVYFTEPAEQPVSEEVESDEPEENTEELESAEDQVDEDESQSEADNEAQEADAEENTETAEQAENDQKEVQDTEMNETDKMESVSDNESNSTEN